MTRYKLKLKRLDFISAVDAGAQGEIANVALIKRAGDNVIATCRVAKIDEKLGLVFGWALAGTLDGGKTPHVDLQGDAVDVSGDELIKVAAEFMEASAASDVMHDFEQDGRIVFAMPLVPEVNDALGIKSDVHGLAIAMKPSEATFKRFVSGELAAFSIAGEGVREPLAKSKSTRRATAAKVGAHTEKNMTLEEALDRIKELEAKLAELEKTSEEKLEEAEKRASLTDAQRAYYKSLDAKDAKAFLAKSATERESLVKAANEVVHTCLDGTVILKSHGDLALRFAKQADEALKIAKAEKDARELTELRKRAGDTLGNLAGTDEVHVALLKAAESIDDEAMRTKAIETLKSANEAMRKSGTAAGANVGIQGGVSKAAAVSKFSEKLAEFAKGKGKTPEAAQIDFVQTVEGAELYAAATA